jgi:hypothetical protein
MARPISHCVGYNLGEKERKKEKQINLRIGKE